MASNYLDSITDRIQERVGDSCPERRSLYRGYAVLLLAKGAGVTAEDIHDAWVAWACEHRPDHACIVPFAALSPEDQAKDEPFAAHVRELARTLALLESR